MPPTFSHTHSESFIKGADASISSGADTKQKSLGTINADLQETYLTSHPEVRERKKVFSMDHQSVQQPSMMH